MVLCEHAQLASVDFFKKVGNFNWPCRNENILESLSDCWYKESPKMEFPQESHVQRRKACQPPGNWPGRDFP